MKLIIKQQFFTLFDKFDVYDEGDNIVYTVEGQFALTKTLSVLDHDGNEAAKLTRRFFTILPTFDIEVDGEEIGTIRKEFSLLTPQFDIDYMNWSVKGDVNDENGSLIAHISKEVFNLTDTYCIDVEDDKNALHVLMLVLAIDAEKEQR